MVCAECEKKAQRGTVICPDPWKSGARNTIEGGGRKIGENKLLAKRFVPYSRSCKVCKQKLVSPGMYCQGCAYKKGVCSMCGKKILDTKMYCQSSV
eukprot:m51a1_g5014 putative cysteine-rich pdz-binding protein (96) ;mRNA; r:272957-273449